MTLTTSLQNLLARGAGCLGPMAAYAELLACALGLVLGLVLLVLGPLLLGAAVLTALIAVLAPPALAADGPSWVATAATATAAAAVSEPAGFGGMQFALAAVACGNFVLSLSSFYLARQRVTSDRLNTLEVQMREQLAEHGQRIAAMAASAESAVTHEHLAQVYGDIKAIAAQINNLAGQQQQMNDNLRLVLARLTQG